jgi:agmatinase
MNPRELTAAFDAARSRAERSPARVERRAESLLRPGVPTFAETPPVAVQDASEYDAVVYGIPFEGFVVKDPRTFYPQGTAPAAGSDAYSRPGSYDAPAAIRAASTIYSLDHSNGLMPERGLVIGDLLRVADAGDAAVGEQHPDQLLEWVPDQIAAIVAGGAIPLVIGGDHLIPLFSIGGIFKATGKRLGVICYDSHLDLSWEPRYWAGSQWPRLMELGALNPENLVQIGIRGLRNSAFWEAASAELGVRYFSMAEVMQLGLEEVGRRAVQRALDGCDLLYVSVDVDAFDPAALPAQKYPEPGGFTARELIYSLRQVIGDADTLAGFDFCELGPAYDYQSTGAAVAARCFVEVLGALAERPT